MFILTFGSTSRRILIHSRQTELLRVMVNDEAASFEHLPILDQIVEENFRDLHSFDVFYR